MPVVVHRLSCHQLHALPAEAFKICRLRQLSIESRRRNFQHIRSARYRIFDVDDRPELAAEPGAVFVCHTIRVRHAIRTIRSLRHFGPVAEGTVVEWTIVEWTIDKHPQRAMLT